MKKASGMLLLLCSSYNANAQLYIGTHDGPSLKVGLSENTYLSGIQIRPPPAFFNIS
ncbi:hypothetical protein ACQWU4_16435 [Chryseobacterium sp. MIQD13]|uniref:hypothetical protein n=1 Tax=Chryseobacterium sp. MIQD13 TaxID=3422310 RepID=UPI003D2CE6EC